MMAGDMSVLSRRSAAVLAALAALAKPARADEAAPAQPAKLSPPAKPPKAAVVPVPRNEVVAVMGHLVVGRDGKEIGRLTEVLVDATGTPRAAVIDIGGFLGVGSRAIAVEWDALRFRPGSKKAAITLLMSLDAIKAMPAYKGLHDGKPAPVVAPPKPKLGARPGAPS